MAPPKYAPEGDYPAPLGNDICIELDLVQITLGLLKTNFAIAENNSPYTPNGKLLYRKGLFNQ